MTHFANYSTELAQAHCAGPICALGEREAGAILNGGSRRGRPATAREETVTEEIAWPAQ